MIFLTESQQRDPPKPYLHPTDNGRELADSAMTHDCSTPNVLVDPTLKVEFKINAKNDLSDEQDVYVRSEVGVNVASKLPSLICMSKDESNN